MKSIGTIIFVCNVMWCSGGCIHAIENPVCVLYNIYIYIHQLDMAKNTMEYSILLVIVPFYVVHTMHYPPPLSPHTCTYTSPQTLCFLLVTSIVWFQVPYVEESIRDRTALLFYMQGSWAFQILGLTVASCKSLSIITCIHSELLQLCYLW